MAARLDAQESIFFERELEHVKSRTYDVQYPELRARSFIPVDHSVPASAESYVYQTYDSVGMAKVISNYASDLPRADVTGKEHSARVKTLGSSYGYNLYEIKAAQQTGKPLEQRRANAARRAIHEKEDELAAVGDARHNLQGLLNHPNIPQYTARDGGAGTEWETKDPDEILDEMHAFVQNVLTLTKSVEKPDTLVLPPSVYGYIATKRLPDTATTILKQFQSTNPWVKTVDEWQRLESAGVAGIRRAMVYKRSPDKLEFVIPAEFTMEPPHPTNLSFDVACHSRIGGVAVYYPLSLAFMDGI